MDINNKLSFKCSKLIISICLLMQISFCITAHNVRTFLQNSPGQFTTVPSKIMKNYVNSQVIKAKNGSTIKFVCNFQNSNQMKNTSRHKLALNENILWIKENTGVISINGEVKMNKKKYLNSFLFASNMDVSYTLSITNLVKEDSGRYTCQHFDNNLMKYFDLVVLVTPSNPVIQYTVNNGQFSGEKSKIYDQISLIENDNLELDCSLHSPGHPIPKIVWLKNGFLFSNESKIILTNLQSSQHLNNYTCLVQSEALNEPMRINVKLFLYFKPKAQITLNNLNDKSNVQIKNGKNLFKVIENTNQTLTCNSMSNPKLLAVEWYKNGHLFRNGTKKIELFNINSNHTGIYQCRLRNKVGKGLHEIVLQVLYKPKLIMPSVYTGIEGSSVYFTCEIEKSPNLFQVKWFKNDKQLFINTTSLENVDSRNWTLPDYQIETNNTCSVLRIYKLKSYDHNSQIKCVVNSTATGSNNRMASLKSENIAHLNVLYKPVMERALHQIEFNIKENVTLKCLTKANPKGNFRWFFNGNLINTSSISARKLEFINNEYQQSTLNLFNLKKSNSGSYRCEVENSVGISHHTLYLKHRGSSYAPYQLEILNVSHNSVRLNWNYVLFDNIEFQVSVNENEKTINTKMTKVLIENLTESSYYSFKVRANFLGNYSEWSDTLNITTKSFNISDQDLNSMQIKICSLPNNINFKVGFNKSCEDYLSEELSPFIQSKMVNIFILIFVAIIFVLVLMLCCSLTCINFEKMKTNIFAYDQTTKKRQAQLNYLNNITTSPTGYSNENSQYQFPIWRNNNTSMNVPSLSDDIHLSYFSSSKIIPIPEAKEDSHKDAHSIDSLRDDLDITTLTINDENHKSKMNDMFVVKKERYHSNYSAPQKPTNFKLKS